MPGVIVERFTSTVRSAARSASSTRTARRIWLSHLGRAAGLRVRDDGKRASKLAYYSGRGSLAGWLRAVVAQLAIDHHRKQSRTVQTEDDASLIAWPNVVTMVRKPFWPVLR